MIYSRMFFISIKKRKNALGAKDKCVICNEKIELHYKSMDEWKIEVFLCAKCYSKKLRQEEDEILALKKLTGSLF